MGKGKLEKYKEVTAFRNTLELTDFQDDESEKPKGRWHTDIFENDNPIVLELACGKGAYTLELARRNPQKNYIGIDIKGNRIWKGARQALEEQLQNVRFLRIYIDHLNEYFAPNEVDEIWITFPDPYPKPSDRNKRLSSKKFLRIYNSVLKPGRIIHFKTDSDQLFSFTKESVQDAECDIQRIVDEVYKKCPEDELLTIQTDYEKRHLQKGRTISYMRFTLPQRAIG